MALEQLPGQPRLLEREVDDLSRSSRAILEAVQALESIAIDSHGEAVDAVNARTRQLDGRMSAAWKRYDGTRGALNVYSIALAEAHDDATRVIDREHEANVAHYYADQDAQDAEQRVRLAAQSGGGPELADAEADLQRAVMARNAALSDITDARHQFEAIAQRQEDAARKAMAQINESFDGTNDGFWDHVGDFFGKVGDWLASVAQWFKDFVAGVLALVVACIVNLVEAFMQYFVLFALLAVLGVLALIVIVGSPFFAALAAIALLAVAVVVVTAVVREVFAGPPNRVRVEKPAVTSGILDEYPATEPYGALLQELGEVDVSSENDMAASEVRDPKETEVRVVAIWDGEPPPEGDGTIVGWRVEMPSTGEWSPFTSQLNDLNTNVAHALFPWVETKLEQAVFDALAESGALESTAPIMIAGFSQGGMTACEIAMDERLAGRVESIVTAGAPVDQYQHELSGVRFTSFTGPDAVSGLEGMRFTPADIGANPNFEQHYSPSAQHNAGYDQKIVPADTYADMAQQTYDGVRAGDEKFFAGVGEGDYEVTYSYGYTR